jgi:HPt (histidine-containing phosphotransfer) domain-containing protein
MESRDWEEYSIRVHGIKSVLANIGAAGRAEMAYKLEMASKSRDEAACLAGTGPLCDSMLALRDHLLHTPLIGKVTREEKKAVSADVLMDKLERLKKSCAEGRIEETNAAVSELELVIHDEEADKTLERITRSLKSYDYGAAIALIDELTAYLRGKKE